MWKPYGRLEKWVAALALAVILVGLTAEVSRADEFQGQPIYVQNNTDRTLWVAARYIPPGSRSYVSDGFWKIAPGQRMLILYNNGVWMYLHAQDAQGRGLRFQGTPVQATVRGQTVDLYPYDTGTDYDPRVIGISMR
jgi:uncharacterized membrane protein